MRSYERKKITKFLEAMKLAIPVFAECKDTGSLKLKKAFVKAGIAPSLTEELLQFMSLAFARACINEICIKFTDYCIHLNSQTQNRYKNNLRKNLSIKIYFKMHFTSLITI